MAADMGVAFMDSHDKISIKIKRFPKMQKKC